LKKRRDNFKKYFFLIALLSIIGNVLFIYLFLRDIQADSIDNYEQVTSDQIITNDNLKFINLSIEERAIINNLIMLNIKDGFLDGVNSIAFIRGAEDSRYLGTYYYYTRDIKVRIIDQVLSFQTLRTLCHELLHSSGSLHGRVLDKLSSELVCYNDSLRKSMGVRT